MVYEHVTLLFEESQQVEGLMLQWQCSKVVGPRPSLTEGGKEKVVNSHVLLCLACPLFVIGGYQSNKNPVSKYLLLKCVSKVCNLGYWEHYYP